MAQRPENRNRAKRSLRQRFSSLKTGAKNRFSSLTTGAKAVVWVAGAIVTIAAAIGVIVGLLPHHEDPTATFEDVSAEPATLRTYSLRYPDQSHATARTEGTALAVSLIAQPEPVPTDTSAQDDDADADTTDDEGVGTETDGETSTDDDGTSDSGEGFSLSAPQRAALDNVQQHVLDQPRTGGLGIDAPTVQYSFPGCESAGGLNARSCGLKSLGNEVGWLTLDGKPTKVKRIEAARKLLEILDGSRVIAAGAGKVQPLGALVNLKLTMDHCDGDRLRVTWTMSGLGAQGWQPADEDWLRNQHATWIDCRDDRKRVPEHFWVPLPRDKGPFSLKVSVHDGDTELDYRDQVRLPN